MTTRTQKPIAAPVAPTTDGNTFSLISNQKLLDLYGSMLKCRLLDERARKSARRPRLGHEAAAVAVALDLLPGDTVQATQNDLFVRFLQGESLAELFRTGNANPARQDASALLGQALLHKTRNDGKIVVLFSDPASRAPEHSRIPAPWTEAIQAASAHDLPMIFVRFNGEEVQPPADAPRAKKPAPAVDEVPIMTVDANDVVANYRVAFESISRARRGRGPTLINCIPFRCEANPAPSDDSILNMEQYLTRKGLFNAEIRKQIKAEFSQALDAAVPTA